ncbi:glycosyl hydrolase family 95 catalytic domain-containing protein [Carboxylicivirga sp. RSCT41]|uniref:glycosyl hydrolase family 95 catalytic domain-containing protein n=1 Tax=Carboxylicivirga agarovorans TaxID=3417570 RepID=UPI003D326E87
MKLLICMLLCWVSFGTQVATAQSGWEISTTQKDNYVPTCVANGQIGIVPDVMPFKTRDVVLNHVFDRGAPYDVSRVLHGVNPFNLEVMIDGSTILLDECKNWQQVLNMREAHLSAFFQFGDKATVEYSLQALRNMPFGGLMQVKIEARDDIELDVANCIHIPANYQELRSLFRMMRDLDARMPVFQTTSVSPYGAHEVAAASGFLFEGQLPELNNDVEDVYNARQSFKVKLTKGQVYSFSLFGAVCTSRDFNDPYGESERMVVFAQREGAHKLIARHKQEWAKLWESDIIIEGDIDSQLDVRFALYNLYSYQRADTDLSISPMGLSAPGYNGHVFWDSEIWMYPPLLLLQPEMGQAMMNYRINRLDKARQKARNYGFKGAMYPWESDDSGEEATPTWCLTGTFEQHISADVGIALWNYYRLTRDLEWLKNRAWPVLRSIAEFWTSRVGVNEDGSYSIVNVVGANEFAHGVTDNAFTNGSVKVVLNDVIKAAKVLSYDVPDRWLLISDGLRIESFEDGVTREHATYNGEVIKQADVNLLAYPLGLISDPDIVKKDLEYYESRISPVGPAMTFSVFSVLYARLGQADKAFEMFQRSYQPNKRAPFGVLAESAVSDNPYFATGAGGMLQAVLYGFAGIELTDDGIEQGRACLPDHWKSLTITGVGSDKKTISCSNDR